MKRGNPAVLLAGAVALGATAAAAPSHACADEERTLELGFYARFEPVSYSADREPGSPGFDSHRGYEADLLNALEAMRGAKLSFSRKGIAVWNGIWLLPDGPRYDIVGGGITILDSRTRDETGRTAIVFTSGHIEFRQSLLVRAEDAERLARHRNLTGADRVGVLAGTTGEARLLELTGIADGSGVLAASTRVDVPEGTIVADGGADYVIDAAGASPEFAGRPRERGNRDAGRGAAAEGAVASAPLRTVGPRRLHDLERQRRTLGRRGVPAAKSRGKPTPRTPPTAGGLGRQGRAGTRPNCNASAYEVMTASGKTSRGRAGEMPNYPAITGCWKVCRPGPRSGSPFPH